MWQMATILLNAAGHYVVVSENHLPACPVASRIRIRIHIRVRKRVAHHPCVAMRTAVQLWAT